MFVRTLYHVCCVIAIFWPSLILHTADGTCYFPHGNAVTSTGDQPCFPLDPESMCCSPGYACLENKMCQKTAESNDYTLFGLFWRNSCTDQSFNSPGCPNLCVNAEGPLFSILAYLSNRRDSNILFSQLNQSRTHRSLPQSTWHILLRWRLL